MMVLLSSKCNGVPLVARTEEPRATESEGGGASGSAGHGEGSDG